MTHARLKDVAEFCGVSISTASRALNGELDVNVKTREKVLNAAKLLGYVPSSLAKGLWSGRTMTVGILVTTVLNPFYANVVTGIEEVLEEAGYNIFLSSSHENPELELRAVRLFLEQRVDGIILSPVLSNPAVVRFLEKNGVPFVLVGRSVEHCEFDCVVCDDRRVGQLAVDHLVDRGHHRILFLNSSDNQSAVLRAQGFRLGLKMHDLNSHENWIRPVPHNVCVTEVLSAIFDEGLDPTAIFCFCDDMAIKVLQELRRRKIRVPQNIAVIGVDNLSFTDLLNPALTTVDVQQSRMGITSAKILLAKLANPDEKPRQVILTPRLIVRDSS